MIDYGFFNATKQRDGSYDRGYNSEQINNYFKGAISENGIYKFVGNQCKVTTYNGMSILVKDGKGAIKFHWFELKTDEAVAITQSHPTLSRWSAVVARYDRTNRQITLATIDGEYEEIPSKPELIRNDNIFDLCLAYIYVEAGSTEITIDDIHDTREDEELCGFVKTLLDNGSGGGIPKVDNLPLPQASEVGKLYYLTKQDGEFPPGFYTCEKSTIYGYKDITMLSGLIADRPDPSFEYANQVYFATDELKYYVCKKNIDEIYEWTEIAVNEVAGLPTASIDTLNNYYLDTTDNTLHLGISEDGYGFSPFSGGGGNFAIIQISCPPGTNVRVSHNGKQSTKTLEEGIWLYGCKEIGDYIISIPNTSVSQTVTITDEGQVESVYLQEQTQNYNIIYLLGEEASELPSEQLQFAYTRYSETNIGAGASYVYTPLNLDYSKYDKLFAFFNMSMSKNGNNADCSGGYHYCNNSIATTSDAINIFTTRTSANYRSFSNCKNIAKTKFEIVTSSNCSSSSGATGSGSASASKRTNNIYMTTSASLQSNTANSNCVLYAVVLCNIDDISHLSYYGSDIATILTNSSQLLNDENAVNQMLNICTGDFMLSACSNATFKAAYNNSPYKNKILADLTWSKFLPLLDLI